MAKVRKLSREDEVLRRMLSTPPKPHSEMKIGKKKRAAKAKKSRAQKA